LFVIAPILGSAVNHRSISFGYVLHLLVKVSMSCSMFHGFFIGEEVSVGDKGSRDTTTVDV